MAYLNEEELVDAIRHVFTAEDDSGVCEATLPAPVKRQKPGGLPLNFRNNRTPDEYDDGQEWMSSSPEIRADGPSRMRTYTMKQMELMQKAKKKSEIRSVPWKTPPADLLRTASPFEERRVVKPDHFESATSKLIAESPTLVENPFLEFARFEASRTERFPSQSFLIFFPMAEDQSPIRVLVRSTAKISDLIGLCCFKYTYIGRMPPLKHEPTRYQLLMADETGDIETDLPPLPPNDVINRLGFPAFALVERPVVKFEQKPKDIILVYMTSGKKYQFELESLDVTLEWLRDQVLEQRLIQIEDTDGKSHRRVLNEYVFESLQVRDVCLPMDMTIAQAGTNEFVMLRKNSSRGDFLTPMQKRLSLKELELAMPSGQQLGGPSPTTPGGGRSPNKFPMPWNRRTQHGSFCSPDGAVPDEFTVNRVHKYKPKWPAKLLFKQDTIEVVPPLNERKNSIFKQSFKQSVIAFECIGGAEIAEERPFGKKLVRISYQPTDGKQEWKMLHLEAEPDDTWQIVSKINDLVDVKKLPARVAYLAKTPTKRLPSFLQFGSTSALTLPRRNSEQSSASKKSLAPDFR